MKTIITFFLCELIIFTFFSQTVVKMSMPPLPDEPLNVITLYDEGLPLNTTVVLGAIGYSVTGGTAPYTFQWLKNEVVFATGDIAVLKPESGTNYSLKITDKNNCFTVMSINVDATKNVSSAFNKRILVTPTYVIDKIAVSFVDIIPDKSTVRIFDGKGILHLQTEITGNGYIPLQLQKGTYYVVIEYNKEFVAEKIIVQ
jgi:hypothetical protein